MTRGSGLVAGCLDLGCVVLGKLPDLSEWCTCPSSLPAFSYIGDCEISAELQKIQAGVNGIQVRGAWWDCPPPIPAPGVGGWAGGSGLMLEQAAEKVQTPNTG